MTTESNKKNIILKQNFVSLEEINDTVIINTYTIQPGTTKDQLLYEDVCRQQQIIITPIDGYVHFISLNKEGEVLGPSIQYNTVNQSGYNQFMLMIQYNPTSDYYQPDQSQTTKANDDNALAYGNHYVIYDLSASKLQQYTDYSFFVSNYSAYKKFIDIQNTYPKSQYNYVGFVSDKLQQGQPFMLTIYTDFMTQGQSK